MDTTSDLTGTGSVQRRARRYRAYVLGVLTMVGICSWMDRQLFAIVLEAVKHDLHFSDTQLGLLGGIAFGLFYTMVGLPIAKLADRINRRNLIAAALAVWSAMTAISGASGGFASMFLARMGVGIGEAGGAPASQSIISDYFGAHARGRAMGLLYTFVPLGYVLAYSTGGLLNERLGWRAAFIWLGAPGLILAALVRWTIREPRRGAAEARATLSAPAEPLPATLAGFVRVPALRHFPIAGALHGIGAFAAAVWVPAYFMREYSMSSLEIGERLAVLMGSVGLAGALLGGYLCDRLVARSRNNGWYAWVPGAFLLTSVPFLLGAFSARNPTAALLFYAVPVFCNHVVLGPIVSGMQALVRVNERATVAAYYLLLVNLIASGGGPIIVGFCSDFFHARFGNSSLRLSLMTLTATTCAWAAVHLFLAARTINADMRRHETPAGAAGLGATLA